MTSGALLAAEEDNNGVPLLPEKQQDPKAHAKNNASFLGAVLNLSTSIVGAVMMALPDTMKILGLIPGLSLLVLVGLLTYVSIEFLLRFSRAGKVTTYGGVMADAFGQPGRIVLQVCIIVRTLGILMIYLIIIGHVVSGTSSNGVHHTGVLEEWFGFHWWTGRTSCMFLTTVVILVPLVSFRHVEMLMGSQQGKINSLHCL